jgi:hypothetical protein
MLLPIKRSSAVSPARFYFLMCIAMISLAVMWLLTRWVSLLQPQHLVATPMLRQPGPPPLVIASFTTIPSRINLILPTVLSLLRQTYTIDRIELNLPYICERTNETYEIPAWLPDVSPRLHIYRTPDYGAITKIAPTLLRHKDEPNVYVWAVDDDRTIPSHTLAVLLGTVDSTHPAALGFVGGLINWGGRVFPAVARNEYRRVDVLTGFGTVLYPPGCIRDDFETYLEMVSADPDARKSDDITLANYFAKVGVPRYTIAFPERQRIDFNSKEVALAFNFDAASLHKDGGGHPQRYVRVLTWFQAQGHLWLPVAGERTSLRLR